MKILIVEDEKKNCLNPVYLRMRVLFVKKLQHTLLLPINVTDEEEVVLIDNSIIIFSDDACHLYSIHPLEHTDDND